MHGVISLGADQDVYSEYNFNLMIILLVVRMSKSMIYNHALTSRDLV